MAHRTNQQQEFRNANGQHTRHNCVIYPSELVPLPRFGKWLQIHVRLLRAAGFPIPEDVVKLSAPPSKIVTLYNKLWAYGAHFRCDTLELSSHATYDSGVALLESEIVDGSFDVGILSAMYMVSFGSLNVVLMKLSWLKHYDQGRRCIKKDSNGF